MRRGLPGGIVTFLFTDIEDSTRLWEEAPADMADALRVHDEILAVPAGVNTRDAVGRVLTATLPGGQVMRYSYDTFGTRSLKPPPSAVPTSWPPPTSATVSGASRPAPKPSPERATRSPIGRQDNPASLVAADAPAAHKRWISAIGDSVGRTRIRGPC